LASHRPSQLQSLAALPQVPWSPLSPCSAALNGRTTPNKIEVIQSFSGFVSDSKLFFQNFPKCELLSGVGTGRSARTASFQVSRARAFRRVPVSFKYLQWLQAGRARSVPLYGRHRVFVEGGIPMPQVPSGRQGVASPCQIRLTSTIRSSASS
jgi:hypothetical protein